MKFKFLIQLIVLSIFTIKVYSQKILINVKDSSKYFLGTQEPDPNWRNIGFDDSPWLLDTGRIGFNEKYNFSSGNIKKDTTTTILTVIPKTTSVYLRKYFKVSDKTKIHKLLLYNDYNDGFVAYLNGVEIARANLGKPGEFIAHDRVANRTHKSYGYRNYFEPIIGYYIDSSVVNKIIKNDTNILSIQVHNDSINGSDLAFECALVDLTGYIYSYDNNSITNYSIQQVALDTAQLDFPIVVINTDGYGMPDRQGTYKAKMGIINNANGKKNKISDPYNDYNGFISIKLHGHSSVDFPKKGYAVETEDSLGNNNNVPLMGMPADNDWILSAQFTDKSLMRNEFAFHVGRSQGHYEPRTHYCELILNGEYLGLYTFVEKIKRDSNRVDVAKLTSTDLSGDELTGGYIVKYDWDNYTALQIVYPKSEDIQPQQTDYINQYFKDYYNALGGPRFLDTYIGFKQYMDPQSLVDYIIAEESFKNPDAYYLSTFMYKDKHSKNGKIKYGPIWDDDLSIGNGVWQNGCDYTGWQFDNAQNGILRITRIMQDTSVVHLFQKSWAKARKTYLNTDTVFAYIDSVAKYIKNERIRNFQVWPIIDGTLVWPCPSSSTIKTYEDEMIRTKTFLSQRLNWIDNNIPNLYYKITDVPSITAVFNDFNIYPNPFTWSLNIKFNLSNPGNYYFELYDVFGRKVSSSPHTTYNSGENEYLFSNSSISNLPKGIYILTVIESGNIVYKSKLIKE